MCKSEIFAKIINAVSEETEVTVEEIMSKSKNAEVVDARAIVIMLLSEYGFYPESISKLLNKTSACVRFLISSFDERKRNNKIIEIYTESIRKSFEKECLTTQ